MGGRETSGIESDFCPPLFQHGGLRALPGESRKKKGGKSGGKGVPEPPGDLDYSKPSAEVSSSKGRERKNWLGGRCPSFA